MIGVQEPWTAAEGPGSVLVVEDDAGMQNTLCEILSLSGVSADGVGSAAEATRWLDNHVADLVLLDQNLPDTSGLQFAALLRGHLPLLPIVLLTGDVTTQSAIAAVGLVDDYLTKPVPPSELIKVVATRLEQHQLRRSNQDLLAQLREANARLENTVEERTVQLRQARDEAMEASRLKSQFLANMSHEIRTPLNGVLGAAELLERTALSEEQATYVEILASSGQALLGVINDVLDFSKIEAGHLELHRDRFALRRLYTDVVAMVAPQAQRKGVGLALHADVPETLEVFADRGRLRQVLLNLLANAIKFTDAGGITVDVNLTRTEAGTGLLRCEVTDTGVGIPAESAGRLFQDFTQLDTSDTRRFGGTGLGLAISSRLLALMGGRIGYQPNPAGGSVFWFTATLELADDVGVAAPARRSAAAEVRVDEEEPAILIVEDNETNALILTRMLAHLGYSSRTATSGAAALEAIVESHFRAVLMDCQMPVQDGFATTEAIRQLPNGQAAVPVIAITATATTEDQQRCLAAGMNDYLPKPIVMERLLDVVSRWAPRPAGD